MKSPHQLS